MSRICLAWLLAFAGCYSPETPDCGLACAADTDCVSGQVCTSDHWCAASGTTTCAGRSVSDGGTVGSDAASMSDAGHPDAGVTSVTITIQIMGGGSVDASPGGNCDSGTCQFTVPVSTAVTLTATGHGSNVFLMWTTSQCGGQNSVCHFAPATSTTVGVKFGHD